MITIIVIVSVMAVVCHNSVCTVSFLLGFFGIMMPMGLNIERKLRYLFDDFKIERNEVKFKNDIRDFLLFHTKARQLSITEFRYATNVLIYMIILDLLEILMDSMNFSKLLITYGVW